MLFPHNQEVLFTCQKHDAEKAGIHYDYRIVVGNKAYSWATFKDLPEPGKAIILHEQPVHTADYALSKQVVIPSGQYGAGITNLLYAKRGKVSNKDNSKDKFVIETNKERYLIKHVPAYGEKMWLFKNLSGIEKKADEMNNKYLEKIASDLSIAKKSRDEEEKAIHDYTERLKTEKNPTLRKSTQHALDEEKDHAESFKESIKDIEKKAGELYLEKIATKIHQYEHLVTHAYKWHADHERKPNSKAWKPTGKVKYVRKVNTSVK